MWLPIDGSAHEAEFAGNQPAIIVTAYSKILHACIMVGTVEACVWAMFHTDKFVQHSINRQRRGVKVACECEMH